MRARVALLAALLVAGVPAPALAVDYLSVGEASVLFDAPSTKAQPRALIRRGTPVEQVVIIGAWVKVRAPDGALAWMEKARLSEQRTLICRQAGAQVRSSADDNGEVLFEAAADVLFELLDGGVPGWARVRYADGRTGFVKATQVWGL